MKTQSNCLLVLGMHRSGTSALAGVLSILGAYPGATLLPGQTGINPKGFWENAKLVEIHDDLLARLGFSWDDNSTLPDHWWLTPAAATSRGKLLLELRSQFDDAPLWLVKDPRLCRLLPLWLGLFDEFDCRPSFLISLRHPAEVARSLRKRDGFSEPESCLLWLSYMLDAERLTRNKPRVIIAYDRLLSDWRGTIIAIDEAFSLRWRRPAQEAATEIDTFLDPALRHHAGETYLPDHPACRMANEAYRALANETDPGPALDSLRQPLDELRHTILPWAKPLPHFRGLATRLATENRLLQAELTRVKTTFSWRITKPLRAAWNLLRRRAA